MESPFTQLDELVTRDEVLRAELVARGELFGGYHPEMEAVHTENGKALEELLDAHGWPDSRRDGEAAQRNAWLIIMHAISLPSLQWKVLALLKQNPSGCTPAQLATLEDRTLVLSGKQQKYGTQFDWDATGELNPYPIGDEEHVDARRSECGLPLLKESIAQHRSRARAEGETPPANFADYIRKREAWMLRAGWIPSTS